MRFQDYARLFLLAAIWGGAFVFIRYLVPIIGPWLTVEFRVMIAGVFLLVILKINKIDGQFRANWWRYGYIALLNTAIPFCLISFAALNLPANYLSILNASTPAWGALFAMIMMNERYGFIPIIGFVLGIIGVGLVTNIGAAHIGGDGFYISVAACLGAACFYGYSGILIRKYTGHLPSFGLASYGQIMAGFMILPMSIYTAPMFEVTWQLAGIILMFAVLCSGLAYVLFFQLMNNVGAVNTLTVTYLIPVFGILWGYFFLNETITVQTLLGFFIIIFGTLLVTRRTI